MDNANSKNVRMVLDTGSHRTYITEGLAKELYLKILSSEYLNLHTFGSETAKEVKSFLVEMQMTLLDGTWKFNENTVSIITGKIHRAPLNFNNPLLHNLQLANTLPKKYEEMPIDLLIGNDYYYDLITLERIELASRLYLTGSRLSWIISGCVNCTNMLKSQTTLFVNNMLSSYELLTFEETSYHNMMISAPWNIPIDDTLIDDGKQILQQFKNTLMFHDSRYFVTGVWKYNADSLSSNFSLALGRLNSLLKRLKDNPKIIADYQKCLKDQLQKGVIEKVDNKENSGLKHYLPHHPVLTPDESITKVKIVYDASARLRSDNRSLDDCLHKGPIMLIEVRELLIRFRLNDVAIVADIEKAILQIGLQRSECEVT